MTTKKSTVFDEQWKGVVIPRDSCDVVEAVKLRCRNEIQLMKSTEKHMR